MALIIFKNGLFPPSFFFIFVSSTQFTVNKCSIKVCRWLDSNWGSLESEATTLPTEPQPLPIAWIFCPAKSIKFIFVRKPFLAMGFEPDEDCLWSSTFDQRTLTVGISITIQLVSSFTSWDSTVSLHRNYNIFSFLVKSSFA